MPESDDSDLVKRAVAGDDDAFADLAGRYRDRVFAMAARFARGRHELEDLAQEIFIRAWKGLESYREDAPFEHWFMRISVRTCYDFLRKHRRRRDSEVLVDEMPPHPEIDFSGEADPVAQRREAWELVRSLLEELGEKDRLAITLVDLEQHSINEAAALTGWSESNVKVRAFRARKRLREIYERRQSERERRLDSHRTS